MLSRCSCKWEQSDLDGVHETLAAELFPLELDIVTKLHAMGREAYDNGIRTGEWTAEVKSCLHKLGTDEGYLVYPEPTGDGGKFEHGWLFDVVWTDAPYKHDKEKPDWSRIRGLKLACESEWCTTWWNILEDFLKLTLIESDIRLFIYTNRKVDDQNKNPCHPVDLCRRACRLSKGYRYLLVGFGKGDKEKDCFRVDAWTA